MKQGQAKSVPQLLWREIGLKKMILIAFLGVLYGAVLFGTLWNLTVSSRTIIRDANRHEDIEVITARTLFHDGYFYQCDRIRGAQKFLGVSYSENGPPGVWVNLKDGVIPDDVIAPSREGCKKLFDSYYRQWGRQ